MHVMKQWFETMVLPSLVILLGVTASIGYLLQNQTLLEIGRISASSPLPLPFLDIQGGQENFSYSATLELQYRDGQSNIIPLQTIDMDGPHRRIIAYVVALQSWATMPPLGSSILQQGFCGLDSSLHQLPQRVEPERITVRLFSRYQQTIPAQIIPVVCVTS